MASPARSTRTPGRTAVRPQSRASTCVEAPSSVPGRDWEVAPADKYTGWTQWNDKIGLDRWIRSPAAPPTERIDALERWLADRPNRYVLGEWQGERGKYSPVAEHLRARLADPVFRTMPLAERVWIALARSGWLGEHSAEKSVSDFTRRAELPIDALPRVSAEAAAAYIPSAREHLWSIFHDRAESTGDLAERLALYGSIHRLRSAR